MTKRTTPVAPKAHKFRSGLEKKVYEAAQQQGLPLVYEPPDIRIPYTISHNYIPDFVLPNGILIEVKGWLRPSDRTKMRKIKEQNPSLDIRFVFQNPKGKLTKSKNSETYGDWAERLGFQWAQTQIPQKWWEE